MGFLSLTEARRPCPSRRCRRQCRGRRRCGWGEAEGDVDAELEAEDLDGAVALVVVHGDDDIEVAALSAPESTSTGPASLPSPLDESDGSGNTYVLGDTAAAYPTTSGAFQQTCSSCVNQTDLFITKLNATGIAQIYSTYLGGSARDRGIKIIVDANGNAIVGGTTESVDFPLKNPVMTSGQLGNDR